MVMDMTYAELHNFLTTRPSSSAMRQALRQEGVNYGSLTKPGLEALILDLMAARK